MCTTWLGGPFLRAALPSFDSASADSAAAGLLHVWLAAGGARSLADGGAGGGAAGGAGTGGGAAAGGVIRRLGPYRFHVLSATVGRAGDETSAGAAAGDSLQPNLIPNPNPNPNPNPSPNPSPSPSPSPIPSQATRCSRARR